MVKGRRAVEVCPGTIDPTSVAYCGHPDPPSSWVCDMDRYADGIDCYCRCGVRDPDCTIGLPGYCTRCPDDSCAMGDCRRLDSQDETHCS